MGVGNVGVILFIFVLDSYSLYPFCPSLLNFSLTFLVQIFYIYNCGCIILIIKLNLDSKVSDFWGDTSLKTRAFTNLYWHFPVLSMQAFFSI